MVLAPKKLVRALVLITLLSLTNPSLQKIETQHFLWDCSTLLVTGQECRPEASRG